MLKKFFLLSIFIILLNIQLKSQIEDPLSYSITVTQQDETNAEIAGPEHVLVVFNRNNSSSDSLKSYYVSNRGIPSINIVKESGTPGLNIPTSVNYGGQTVLLTQNGEVIKRDATCTGPNQVCDTLAWYYFEENIASPIRNYLNNTYDSTSGQYLKDKIRYIVLIKGIPLKIWSQDHALGWAKLGANISVSSLLSVLNTESNTNNPPVDYYWRPDDIRAKKNNPYFGADANLTMNYRFLPNHFSNQSITLSYLVSVLNAETYSDVYDMIDMSFEADKSGEGIWILDGHPQYDSHNTDATATKNILNSLGLSVEYNISSTPIYSTSDKVIGYTSQGRHAGYDSLYFQSSLEFDYLNGAIANTYESFNINSMYPEFRRDQQGLISEFIKKRSDTDRGGTTGVGHCWEPYTNGVIKNNELFPKYAIGYSLVDAAYMGMPFIIWNNIVIGDPLTTIAWGKQTLTVNTEWEGTNLVAGKITVPQYKTLTIKEDAEINFRHLGSLEIDGFLMIEKGAKLNFYNGGQLVVNNGIKISGASNKYVEIDFISPNSTTENGIILNDGAFEDSLMYVKIKNAYRGLTVNETAPYINCAEITNCETGIYMYKSDYELTMNEGSKILNSDISANQTGIYLNESSPQFISNNISSNNIAIEMTNESAPVFGEYLEPGVNTFSANEYNIIAISAYPTLGAYYSGDIGEDYFGGFNEFTGSSYQFVSVDDNGYVLAELNWWDGSTPDPNMFDEIRGTIDYDPWLESPSSPLKGGGNEDNSIFISGNENSYNKILIDIAKNDINEAWRSLKNKLNETPSMFGIFLLKTLSNNTIVSDSSKIIMQQLSLNNNLDEETRAYAKLSLINKRNNNNFTGQLNQTANSIQNNNIKGLALFKLFSHYYFSENDKENAIQVLNRMRTASVSEKWITEAEKLLGNYQSGNNQNVLNNNQTTGNEITMGNYPNPFNPVTKINFNLPERNFVELSVYNILGQKVITLTNEILEAGSYSVPFDASKLPSGIYIYNLRAGSFNKSAKMLLLK